MNRELIKNLKNLKNDGRLNPDRAWLARNREEVLDCVRRQSENQKAARPNFLEVLSEGLHVFVSGRVLGLARTGLTVFLIGILAVGGWIASVSASYSSLPGEILYGVKIAAEKTELIMASVIGSKEDEVTTILKHASTRVDEYQRSKSAEQSSEAIESLKKKIESTQESLDDASQSTSKTAVAVARVVEKKTGEPILIIQDLQGPKIRVGALPKEGVVLTDHAVVCFDTSQKAYAPGVIPVDYEALHQHVRVGERLLLDDGKIETAIKEVRGSAIIVTVVHGGFLTSHKGINVPDSTLEVSALTDKDKNDVAFGVQHGIDTIALSFVMSAKDVFDLKYVIEQYEKDFGVSPLSGYAEPVERRMPPTPGATAPFPLYIGLQFCRLRADCLVL